MDLNYLALAPLGNQLIASRAGSVEPQAGSDYAREPLIKAEIFDEDFEVIASSINLSFDGTNVTTSSTIKDLPTGATITYQAPAGSLTGAVHAVLVQWLEDLLRSRPMWVTAAQILQLLGKLDTDSGKRQLRLLSNASEWIISGQKGYKHLDHATAEEISHFANWMESQAKQMIQRAESVRRNAHKIFG